MQSPSGANEMRLSVFSVQDHYEDRPRSVPQLYAQVAEQAELADALGYDTFFVAEHHFHQYGAVPNPAVMLAALAQRTKRLRLGSAISILTFHHPLTVAESYAMVDVLSGGRLVLGVGSGYLKHEFAGYAVDPAEKRERFDEALAVVRAALAGETVTAQGRFSAVDGVRINVPPVQKRVPIYVAILRREAALHVGRQGHDIMCVPYASVEGLEDVGAMIGEYARGREAGGHGPGDSTFALHTHVADSDADCRHEAADAFDLYVATRLYARRAVYDDVLRSRLCLFGGVDSVVERMVALHRMGVRHVMTLQNFGLMAPELVKRSMRLMAEEVMPRVRARIAAASAA